MTAQDLHTLIEAFEARREAIDDEQDQALMALALEECQAIRDHQDATEGDILEGLLRVVAGPLVEGAQLAQRECAKTLMAQMSAASDDAKRAWGVSSWVATARCALRLEDSELATQVLDARGWCEAIEDSVLHGVVGLLALELTLQSPREQSAHDAAFAAEQLERAVSGAVEGELEATTVAEWLEPLWRIYLGLGDVERALGAARAWLSLEKSLGRMLRVCSAYAAIATLCDEQGARDQALVAAQAWHAVASAALEEHPDDGFLVQARADAEDAVASLSA
ncbi:MAG: hypothetical protein Q8Q09_05680 [Deltaproteobacteria bacterium]|nr:hypothetical protein [Deltaproteobacteria bacterium]